MVKILLSSVHLTCDSYFLTLWVQMIILVMIYLNLKALNVHFSDSCI
jgi:hypothetical protein